MRRCSSWRPAAVRPPQLRGEAWQGRHAIVIDCKCSSTPPVCLCLLGAHLSCPPAGCPDFASRLPACSNEALQAWERSLVAQTWERCQQQLFLHALQPHPLTAHVLGCVWSDLAAAASESLLKAHITALHDLLRLAAAAEAAGGHRPPSPLYMQLLALLACLLAAAPPATWDAYFANFLQASPGCLPKCLSARCCRCRLLVHSLSALDCDLPQRAGSLSPLPLPGCCVRRCCPACVRTPASWPAWPLSCAWLLWWMAPQGRGLRRGRCRRCCATSLPCCMRLGQL